MKKLKIKEVSYTGINLNDGSESDTDGSGNRGDGKSSSSNNARSQRDTSPSSLPVHTVEYRMFEYNYLRYLYDCDQDAFVVQ